MNELDRLQAEIEKLKDEAGGVRNMTGAQYAEFKSKADQIAELIKANFEGAAL